MLAVLVFAPVILAAVAMLLTTATMLNGIAVSVNRQESDRAWQAIQSGFEAAGASLENTVIDNANWDDAARNTYPAINGQWMDENFGVGSKQGIYDTMYVVDKNGKTLIGFHEGRTALLSASEALGQTLNKVLASFPAQSTNVESRYSTVWTPMGLAVMAVGPIRPADLKASWPSDDPRYLLLMSPIDASALAHMGRQYIVQDLRVANTIVTDSDSKLLRDRWAAPVAVVSWTNRRPGDLAGQSYQGTAKVMMLALVGALLPISGALGFALFGMRKSEQAALQFAGHDALSGLPNRQHLFGILARKLASSHERELALLFIDLDGFKAVNDAYDHATGDLLIRAVSAGLAQVITEKDILARVGGDEFAMLIFGDDAPRRALETASRIHAFMNEPFEIAGLYASVGASIGIAFNEGAADPSELMRRADIAMYEAKDNGRNRALVFAPEMDQKREEDQHIATELRQILERKEIDIAYQPIVDAATRNITGLEILARWPSSSERNIGPDRFIRVAEEHGHIDRMSELVMENALREASRWPNLTLAFNVSPLQMKGQKFADQIASAARKHAVDLSRIELEITENVLIKSQRVASVVIAQLRALGVKVVLDDFGAGFASAGYLRQYAFSGIKIDKSLTQAVLESDSARKIVQGVILMAQGLSSEVVAEGIETKEQAAMMYLAGCRKMQGYLFGKPMTAGGIDELLAPTRPETAAAASA